MKTKIIITFMIFTLFSFIVGVLPVYSDSPDGIIKNNKNSIVQVIDKGSSTRIKGFGTLISSGGIVLTTTRALNGEDIYIRTSDLRLHKIEKVLFSQPEDNMAIVKIDKANSYPDVDYSSKVNVKLGDKVVNLSSFYNGDYKATSSVIGKLIGSAAGKARIMVLVNNENIQPSLEGSPVFSKKGQLIGFISLVSGRNYNKVAYSPVLDDFKEVISKYITNNVSKKKNTRNSKIKYNENIAVVEEDKQKKEAKKVKKKRKPLFSFFSKNKHDKKKEISKATKTTKTQKTTKATKPVKTSKKKKESIISKPDEIVSSAYGLSRKAYRKKEYPPNDFSIPLTGLWFDTATGQSIYVVQNGSIVELKKTQSKIYDDSLINLTGSFKKEGNKYVGEIVSYLNCDKKYCNVKEPAEILFWNTDKVELRVKSGEGYSCGYCSNPDQVEWKDRMWLKKAYR